MDWKNIYSKAVSFALTPRKGAKEETAIGLDIGSETITALELAGSGERRRLLNFTSFATPQDRKQLSGAIRKLFDGGGFPSRKIRLGIGGTSVLVRCITLPFMTEKELKSSIPYEAEKYIPYKVDEVNLDFHVLREIQTAGGKRAIQIILAAAKKDKITEVLELASESGLEVGVIDTHSIAMFNALQWLHPELASECVCQVDFDSHFTTVNIAEEGIPVFTRDITFGSFDICNAAAKKLNVGYDEMLARVKKLDWKDQKLKDAFYEPFLHIVSEIRLSVDYFEHQLQDGKSIQKLIIHGGLSQIPGFKDALEKELKCTVQFMNFLSRLDVAESVDKAMLEQNLQQAVVALGLALTRGDKK
ncbi:MAG: type IV pilus assembly protein PilM [Candidatus Omnitrophica bacterium]|nr:type IV pilus assembly protein PilM [Candidatus Omnitrophota bacterium]